MHLSTRAAFLAASLLLASGASFNAYTSFDQTVYYIKGGAAMYKPLIELFYSIVMDKPIFGADEFKREQHVVLEERKMRESPAMWAIMRMLLDNTEYEHDIAGTEESIRRITREDVKAYHEKHYEDSYMVASLPRSVKKQASALLHKLFGESLTPCPARPTLRRDLMKIKNQPDAVIIMEPPPSIAPALQGAAAAPDASADGGHMFKLFFASVPYESRSAVMLDFLSNALKGLSGILYARLRGELGYTYGVGVDSVSYIDAGYWCISFQSIHSDVLEVARVFFDDLERLQRNGLGSDEFRVFKQSFLLQEETRLEDASEACGQLGAAAFYDGRLFRGGVKEFLAFADETLEYNAVQAFAKKLFRFSSAKLILATPERSKIVHEEIVKQFKRIVT